MYRKLILFICLASFNVFANELVEVAGRASGHIHWHGYENTLSLAKEYAIRDAKRMLGCDVDKCENFARVSEWLVISNRSGMIITVDAEAKFTSYNN